MRLKERDREINIEQLKQKAIQTLLLHFKCWGLQRKNIDSLVKLTPKALSFIVNIRSLPILIITGLYV